MLHLPDVLDITCNEAVATTTYLQSANIKALHTLALPATVEFILDYFTPAVGQDSDEDADAPPLREIHSGSNSIVTVIVDLKLELDFFNPLFRTAAEHRDSDEDQDKHLFQKRNYYGLPCLPPSRKYYGFLSPSHASFGSAPSFAILFAQKWYRLRQQIFHSHRCRLQRPLRSSALPGYIVEHHQAVTESCVPGLPVIKSSCGRPRATTHRGAVNHIIQC